MSDQKIKKLESLGIKIANSILLTDEDIFNQHWLLTITKAKVSSDKSYIDYFVSCFNDKELLTKTLSKKAYLIKKELSNNINIKKVPQVRFRYDDSWERWTKIINIINSLNINTDDKND